MNKYLKQLLDALAAKQLEKQGVVTKALDAGNTPNEDEEKQIDDKGPLSNLRGDSDHI